MSTTHTHRYLTEPLQRLFDRLPPHSLEAEAAVCGSLLLDGSATASTDELGLTPDDFYKPAHAAIYGLLRDLAHKHGTTDIVQLREALNDRKLLESVGGVDYLIELSESVPSAASVGHYARIVLDKARKRRVIEAAHTAIHDAYHSGSEPSDALVAQLQTALFELDVAGQHGRRSRIGDLIRAEVAELRDRAAGNKPPGIPTGFHVLDEVLGGLQPGRVYVLAARPGAGKTALAINVCEKVAEAGVPTAAFSLEMSDKSLAARVLAGRSGVEQRIARHPHWARDEDWQAWEQAATDMADMPLWIVDAPDCGLDELASTGRRLVQREGVKLIAVDYLQIMRRDKGLSANDAITRLSAGVKRIARELNVPILLLSQLSRAVEQRDKKIPMLSDLRESGSIEQDADVVMFLYREDYYGRQKRADYEPDHGALLLVAKQRDGPTGGLPLWFDGPSTSFSDWPAALPKPGWMGGNE